MSQVARLHPHQDRYEPCLVPPGEYALVYSHHRIVNRFGRDVLEVWFSIIEGPHFRKLLPRYYSVRASREKRTFTAPPHGDFAREYVRLFDRRPRFRMAPLEAFRRRQVGGIVETVKTDYRQKPIPEVARYSKIAELKKAL